VGLDTSRPRGPWFLNPSMCVGEESIHESQYNSAHRRPRRADSTLLKQMNIIEHGLILCLQLSERWGRGLTGRGANPDVHSCSKVTHR